MNPKVVARCIYLSVKYFSRSENLKEFVGKMRDAKTTREVKTIIEAEFQTFRGEIQRELGEQPLEDLTSDRDASNADFFNREEILRGLDDIDFLQDALVVTGPDGNILPEYLEPIATGMALGNEALREALVAERLLDLIVDAESPEEIERLIQGELESLSERVGVPSTVGDEPSEAQVIREIVDTVSDGITLNEIIDIVVKMLQYNLDGVDIRNALAAEITYGEPLSASQAFEEQDLDNCAIALSKVIAAQFGIYVPEGVLTLHAFLGGTLNFSVNGGELVIEGTPTFQISLILEELGVPVHYNYTANLDTIKQELAVGHKVMVNVDVAPIWTETEKEGPHVIEVLHINESLNEDGTVNLRESTVIVNDTGIGIEGNGKEYPLDKFLESCHKMTGTDKIIIIATDEAPPGWTAPSSETRTPEVPEDPLTRTKGDDGSTFIVGNDTVVVDGNLAAVFGELAVDEGDQELGRNAEDPFNGRVEGDASAVIKSVRSVTDPSDSSRTDATPSDVGFDPTTNSVPPDDVSPPPAPSGPGAAGEVDGTEGGTDLQASSHTDIG